MDAAKKDKFMKELISHETIEVVTELKKIIKEERKNSAGKEDYKTVKILYKNLNGEFMCRRLAIKTSCMR